MKPGSVVVDLAAESGGNVEGSAPGEVVKIGHANVWGGQNVAGQMPGPASRLLAQNIVNLLLLAAGEDGSWAPDFEDEIIAGACVTHQGEVKHEPSRNALDGRKADSEEKSPEQDEPEEEQEAEGSSEQEEEGADS
jgi:H+-translocating NAD(P) transhydrogenase subunit alpha